MWQVKGKAIIIQSQKQDFNLIIFSFQIITYQYILILYLTVYAATVIKFIRARPCQKWCNGIRQKARLVSSPASKACLQPSQQGLSAAQACQHPSYLGLSAAQLARLVSSTVSQACQQYSQLGLSAAQLARLVCSTVSQACQQHSQLGLLAAQLAWHVRYVVHLAEKPDRLVYDLNRYRYQACPRI